MADILTPLLTAIKALIDTDASTLFIRDNTNYRGLGLAPKTATPPVFTWFMPVEGEESDFLSPGVEHYNDYPIQFTAATSEESSALAVELIETMLDALRGKRLTLSTGRNLSIDIGAPVFIEDPQSDGQMVAATVTFKTGS